MRPRTVLLVDDDEGIRHSTAQSLELAGFTVREFTSAEAVLDYITPGLRGIVVSDIRMPGMDGMTLLGRVRDVDAEVPVILVTGHGDVQLAVRAMREGAYDFIEKPFSGQHLSDVVDRALDRRGLVLENRLLRAAAGQRDDVEARLPGRSPVMIDLRYRLRAVAGTDADVLIVGDTGVGKEVVARALHDLSGRATRPFVAINCAALPATLIESELFGHEAGAFAGAMRARYGKFEHARGGTVLLDEIGSMPLELQARLLRVFQDRVIVRLGSNEQIALDVRFIANSKVDLEKEVAEGRFRADLYYHLSGVTLRVPPLAARREDVPVLFHQLVREAAGRHRRDLVDPPADLVSAISRREWPGNVRELRNAADRFVLGLDVEGLEVGEPHDSSERLADRVARFERDVIAAAIRAHAGSLKPVYEALGISRKTLYEKMQRHGLSRTDQDDSGTLGEGRG